MVLYTQIEKKKKLTGWASSCSSELESLLRTARGGGGIAL